MKRIDVRDLEVRQRMLSREIHEIERRGAHMSPPDLVRATELKKQRLATKDRLLALRGNSTL